MLPKALTIEEIGEKLKNMTVGEGKYLPMIFVSFLVKNPNYDPTNFSQEIEDSEKEIDVLNEMLVEMKKPGFDIIWNNTLNNIKTNSKRWSENHSKNAKFICLQIGCYYNQKCTKMGREIFILKTILIKSKPLLMNITKFMTLDNII